MNETSTPTRSVPLLLLALCLGPLLVVAGTWLISLSHLHYDSDCLIRGQIEKGWSPAHAQSACGTAWQAQLAGGALLTVAGLVVLTEGRRRA